MADRHSVAQLFWMTRNSISGKLGPIDAEEIAGKRRARSVVVSCLIVFLVAFCVRLFHGQDIRAEISVPGSSATHLLIPYLYEARRIAQEGTLLYPRGVHDAGDARMILHPPGYSIFLAALLKITDDHDRVSRLAQLIQTTADATAAVAVCLIALEVLPLGISFLSGLLVGLSPHLAYYSVCIKPDTLAVLPILIAVYLIVAAAKHPRLVTISAAGILIGISCWLRANAMALAPFLSVLIPVLFKPGRRLRYWLSFIGAAVLVAAPITTRNWIVFHRFIPLSIGSGITMVEGIGDYDKEKRFGMPADDGETKWKDVEWHNRSDYSGGLWRPDGIERDRYRFSRGLEVIRQNPLWFGGVMIRRAGSMLRSNGSSSLDWPTSTANVPIVSAESSFDHLFMEYTALQPVWSMSSTEAIAGGNRTSSQMELSVTESGQALRMLGDASAYGDQFASRPIPVEKNSDYVLKLPVNFTQGRMAAKVTSEDHRIMLASHLIQAQKRPKRKVNKLAEDQAGDNEADSSRGAFSEENNAGRQEMTPALIPFATGNRSEVRLVISNDGASSDRPIAEIGKAELFELGPTPHQWSRLVRPAVRGIQRNLYTTTHMLPLIGFGIILLAIAGRWRAMLIILAVPAYYMGIQSVFHTEYRYILAIHYFLFALAALTLYIAGAFVLAGARRILPRRWRASA